MRVSPGLKTIAAGSVLSFCLALTAHAANIETCEGKRANIERQIEEAQSRGNTHRVEGLQTALREMQGHCSDAQLQKEHAERIQRQERKVAERQADLDKARARGKADKIAEREAKLKKEQAELDKLRSGSN